jgi:hypothetical protein
MGIKLVFNENSKMLQVPTPNSNLNLFTFTFHYINPTNAQQMRFSPVNKTVCLLECAALTSHRCRLKNDILPSFWANYGYNMGIKLVFNEISKMLKVPTPTPT